MFELAMPWVLWLGLLPLLIYILIPRSKPGVLMSMQVPFFNGLSKVITEASQVIRQTWWVSLLWLAWFLLLLAIAGPRWVGNPVPLEREGRNIMMVLDLSRSMELDDMVLNGRPVSRLTVVKRAAKAFVKARAGDRIGLILFGSQAYLQTPLTFDLKNVLMRIDDATAGLAGNSTSLGDALGLAVKRLQNVKASSRVIILLTDGANNTGVLSPDKAAELAKEDGMKVYTIGLGSEADPRALGNVLFSMSAGADLDEKTLQTIAQMTGGRYFRATDTDSLNAIYSKINELETVSQEKATVRPQKEYYPWPLGIALGLLMVWSLGQSRASLRGNG